MFPVTQPQLGDTSRCVGGGGGVRGVRCGGGGGRGEGEGSPAADAAGSGSGPDTAAARHLLRVAGWAGWGQDQTAHRQRGGRGGLRRGSGVSGRKGWQARWARQARRARRPGAAGAPPAGAPSSMRTGLPICSLQAWMAVRLRTMMMRRFCTVLQMNSSSRTMLNFCSCHRSTQRAQ